MNKIDAADSSFAAFKRRRDYYLQERRKGRTFRDIGNEVGLSTSNVANQVAKAIREESESAKSDEIATSNVSIRIKNALKHNGYERWSDFNGKNASQLFRELVRIPNFGRKSFVEVEDAIKARGVALVFEDPFK